MIFFNNLLFLCELVDKYVHNSIDLIVFDSVVLSC